MSDGGDLCGHALALHRVGSLREGVERVVRRRGERQGQHRIGMPCRERLRDRPAVRQPHDVGAVQTGRREHLEQVVGEDRQVRGRGRVGAASVPTQVVGEHPAALGERGG